jgi:hypothetical protein
MPQTIWLCCGLMAVHAGGSVSIPSAFNGIYSIKPSHGRISFKDAANSVCNCEAHGFTCNEADLGGSRQAKLSFLQLSVLWVPRFLPSRSCFNRYSRPSRGSGTQMLSTFPGELKSKLRQMSPFRLALCKTIISYSHILLLRGRYKLLQRL